MEENKLKTIESELEAPADFTSPDVLYRDLVASIRKYHPSDDLSMIEKAYQLAFDRFQFVFFHKISHLHF